MVTLTNTTVVTILVIFLGCHVAYTEVSKRWKAYRLRKEESEHKTRILHEDLVNHISRLIIAFDKNSIDTADSTKLLAGTLKACEAIAASTVELREEIGKFSTLVSGDAKDRSYPEDNITQPPTDAEAEKASVYIEALLRNIPVKQAQQEADDFEEKKMAYSAVSMGPED